MPGRPPLYQQYRPRPINPSDNAYTTGLFSNPNGTYVANPNPTTSQNGQQGTYGSMLPSGNMGVTPLQGAINWANSSGPIVNPYMSRWQNPPSIGVPSVNLGAIRGTYGQLYSGQNISRSVSPFPQSTSTPLPPVTITPGPGIPDYRTAGYTSNPDYRTRGYTNQGTPGQNVAGSSVIDNYNYIRTTGQINEGLIKLMAQKGPESAEYKALSPAQKEAVDRLANKAGGAGGTPGAGQFYGYERNPETGRSERVIKDSSTSNFSKELRWDPDRKKYVEIGKLMKEGKLDQRGGWHKKKKGGGGGGGRTSAPPGKRAGWTGSYGVINFNTGTG